MGMTDAQDAMARSPLPPPASDPLPRRFLLEGEGLGGRLKLRPEDFIVEEIPLYEPSGAGEHLYLLVRKVGLAHGEAVRLLARHFKVPDRAIGFAGMKDKAAVTTQWFSIHTPRNHDAEAAIHERLMVLAADRHVNKLRRGHLVGNRFTICIRDVDPSRAPSVDRRLSRLAQVGAPNYFGEQRFGYRRNNHTLGSHLLMRQWQRFLDELVGTDGAPFPDYQRKRRELFHAGDYDRAAESWSGSFHAERSAAREMARGRDARHACLAIGRPALSFFANATQSAIFNRLLDDRLERGAFDTLESGDLAWKHDSRSVFVVTAADMAGEELSRRLEAMEISPSGPLWGPGMTRAKDEVVVRELAALHAAGLDEASLDDTPCRIEGARRPYRVRVQEPEAEGGADEHGPYIRTRFDLERGAYATVVLREIMKNDAADIGQVE